MEGISKKCEKFDDLLKIRQRMRKICCFHRNFRKILMLLNI